MYQPCNNYHTFTRKCCIVHLHFTQLGLNAGFVCPSPNWPQSLAPKVNTRPLSGKQIHKEHDFIHKFVNALSIANSSPYVVHVGLKYSNVCFFNQNAHMLKFFSSHPDIITLFLTSCHQSRYRTIDQSSGDNNNPGLFCVTRLTDLPLSDWTEILDNQFST